MRPNVWRKLLLQSFQSDTGSLKPGPGGASPKIDKIKIRRLSMLGGRSLSNGPGPGRRKVLLATGGAKIDQKQTTGGLLNYMLGKTRPNARAVNLYSTDGVGLPPPKQLLKQTKLPTDVARIRKVRPPKTNPTSVARKDQTLKSEQPMLLHLENALKVKRSKKNLAKTAAPNSTVFVKPTLTPTNSAGRSGGGRVFAKNPLPRESRRRRKINRK